MRPRGTFLLLHNREFADVNSKFDLGASNRTRTSYAPLRPSEQTEIEERHRRNFHFVGDWHTYPVIDSLTLPY